MSPTAATVAHPPGGSSVTLKALTENSAAKPAPQAKLLAGSDRTIVAEVAAAVLLVGGAIVLASGDLCLPGADIHPLWIPVLVFSARYGVRGMFIAAAVAFAALASFALVQHGVLTDVTARGSSPWDMLALVSCTLVAWTAMIRDGRLARSVAERDEIAQKLENTEETAAALREVVGVLRQRLDRIDLSITMWRAIAARLDHGTPADAAAAALELAAIRTGAAAGVVQRAVNGRLHTIATYGHITNTTDISRDRTVSWAALHRRPALRGRIAGTDEYDSEVAVPIIDVDTGALLGVLAMRDAPPGKLRAAEVRDIEVVSAWLANAFPPPAQLRAGDSAC